jgi:hypothetical protein
MSRIGKVRNVYIILVGRSEGKTTIERPSNRLLKWYSRKKLCNYGLDSRVLGQGPVANVNKYSTESSSSTKCEKFLDHLGFSKRGKLYRYSYRVIAS